MSVAAALLALAGALTATAQGEARAEVVVPLVATREADLDFGAIFATTAAGTVTVSAAGAAGYAGGVAPACAASGCAGPHEARFAVRGEAGRGYSVNVPAAITATGVRDDGGVAPPLAVSAITVRSDSTPQAGGRGQLDGTGRDGFGIGGTLEVPAGVPAARYRATIAVTVSYS